MLYTKLDLPPLGGRDFPKGGPAGKQARFHPEVDPLRWIRVDHPHAIDFDKLPKVPKQHVVIHDVTAQGGVNQHNYLVHFDGRFCAMWSAGPAIENRFGRVVKYATSRDGLEWSEAKPMTDYPPGSGPDSPYYNAREPEGFRCISRGFWVRDGQLLALTSLDEAAGFSGQICDCWPIVGTRKKTRGRTARGERAEPRAGVGKQRRFAGSVSGGERSAGFLTLVSSALRNDLDVWVYVKDVLDELLARSTD